MKLWPHKNLYFSRLFCWLESKEQPRQSSSRATCQNMILRRTWARASTSLLLPHHSCFRWSLYMVLLINLDSAAISSYSQSSTSVVTCHGLSWTCEVILINVWSDEQCAGWRKERCLFFLYMAKLPIDQTVTVDYVWVELNRSVLCLSLFLTFCCRFLSPCVFFIACVFSCRGQSRAMWIRGWAPHMDPLQGRKCPFS